MEPRNTEDREIQNNKMNKWQWSRRIFITISAIGSGTTFLYIKQNIHDIKAINYEGHDDEFDHPFVLLFFVYIGQMLTFSMICLLNGPIRNQVLQDLGRTWKIISSKFICCNCHRCGDRIIVHSELDDANRLIPNNQETLPQNRNRIIVHSELDDADRLLPNNNQQLEPQINSHDDTMIQDENQILYVVAISQPQGRTTNNQDIVHHNPVSSMNGVADDEEGFIQLFVSGDQTLHLINYLPPAILMLLSTSFVYYAFGATYPATIIMFRAVSLGAVGIFRCKWMCKIIRVQQSFSIRQWLAVLIMISAVIHSAYYDLITSKHSEQRNDISYIVTVPLLTIAHIGIALADTYDEKFLHDKKGIPLIMCFVESTLGSIVYLIILPILYLIPDPLYPTTQGGVMENALNAFVQLYNNPTILYYVFGLIISETIWMGARTFITRHSNAIVKTMIDSLQLVFIRYVTPDLYICSEQSEATTVFTVVVFGLGIAVFYFSE